jgi:predicted phage tail protein
MKVVKVYGALREKLGQCRFEFDVDTPAQAIKALCINFPGLERWLVDSEQQGVGYRVTIGKDKITGTDYTPLNLPWSEREVFSIAPVLMGAGGNSGGGFWGSVALGFGLMATAIVLGPAAGGFLGLGMGLSGGGMGIIGGGLAVAIGGIGAALAIGGIAQALSPAPVMSSPAANSMERGRDAAKFESFTFSGIVNTAKQGLPVPIAYGRVFVGSAVLSSGLDVDQIL